MVVKLIPSHNQAPNLEAKAYKVINNLKNY